MDMRRKVTGALAWAGLVIVIAVPTTEFVWSKLAPAGNALPVSAALNSPTVKTKPAEMASVAAPVVEPAAARLPIADPAPVQKTAETMPAESAAPGAAGNALDDYLATGKKLPDYITANAPTKLGTAAATAPATVAPVMQEDAGTQATDAVATGSIASTATPAASVATPAAAASAPPPLPLPASARPKVAPQRTVTEADLKNWKSGTLEDYLRQQGLLTGSDAAQGGSN